MSTWKAATRVHVHRATHRRAVDARVSITLLKYSIQYIQAYKIQGNKKRRTFRSNSVDVVISATYYTYYIRNGFNVTVAVLVAPLHIVIKSRDNSVLASVRL